MQEYWSGLPFPLLGDLPDPEMEPVSLASPSLAGGFITTGASWEAHSQEVGEVMIKEYLQRWSSTQVTTQHSYTHALCQASLLVVIVCDSYVRRIHRGERRKGT